MKVVIFCGGRGMRLESGNFSERLPKPMASIGGRPLLWHIMSYYAHFGHRRFVLCLGYRGGGIRDHFSKPEFERNGWEIRELELGGDEHVVGAEVLGAEVDDPRHLGAVEDRGRGSARRPAARPPRR